MKRSKLKDESFYQAQIMLSERLKEKAKDRFANGLIPPDRITLSRRFRFTENLHLVILRYSAGNDLGEMRIGLNELVEEMQSIWPDDGSQSSPDYLLDWYVNLVWLLSLAVLLDLRESAFPKFELLVNHTGRKDWLLEFLLSSVTKKPIQSDSFLFPSPYSSLKTVVEATPESSAFLLKNYLSVEWYQGHEKCYWYDNHKNIHNTFFGYWSFETAAIVKILGIDDSSFRDSPYYPKDLL